MKKTNHNTKSRIVTAAWQLFYEQGFDRTTVDEVVELSGTSKGSFYHYFSSKEALLGSLAHLFDEKYIELEPTLDYTEGCMNVLYTLNHELFLMIENNIDVDLLARLYAGQLMRKGERELTDRSRYYYKLLRRIVLRGQESGEITRRMPASEVVRLYALSERALLYDWCLHGGEYSLTEYSGTVLPLFLSGLRG